LDLLNGAKWLKAITLSRSVKWSKMVESNTLKYSSVANMFSDGKPMLRQGDTGDWIGTSLRCFAPLFSYFCFLSEFSMHT